MSKRDTIRRLNYLERRLEAAEKYIDVSPCDPDISPKQYRAYKKWKKIKMEQTMEEGGVVNLRQDDFDVYIGRGSRFGNPFVIGKDGNRTEVIRMYREWITGIEEGPYDPPTKEVIMTLKGKVLGCFCKPKACHGDVLISLIREYS